MESKALPTRGAGTPQRGEAGFLHSGRLIQSVRGGGNKASRIKSPRGFVWFQLFQGVTTCAVCTVQFMMNLEAYVYVESF